MKYEDTILFLLTFFVARITVWYGINSESRRIGLSTSYVMRPLKKSTKTQTIGETGH